MKQVVVVGGGVGGMSAAVVCASRGHAVTLLEKEPRLGGYAVSFTRDGFTFDVTPHVVPALEPGGEFHGMLAELGISDRVAVSKVEQGFHTRFGEDSVRLPCSYGPLFERLAELFPAERNGLARLRRKMERLGKLYADVLDSTVSRWRAIPPFLPRLPAFLAHGYMPASRFLSRYVRDRRAMALLFQPAMFWGLPMDEFPTVNLIVLYALLYGRGAYAFAGGGQAVVDALSERMRELGVRIRTGTAARKIVVEKGRVCGVIDQNGERLGCSAVVANVNAPTLIDDLIGPEHFRASHVARVRRLRPSLSVLQMHVGLDCPVGQLGLRDRSTMVFPDDDIDRCIKRQRDSMTLEAFAVELPSPNGAGRRESVLSVVGGVSGAKWFELPGGEYTDAKARATEDILSKLEHAFPGVRKHVSVVALATPRTFGRYTGNPSGAILGYDCACGVHRDILAASSPPIGGLYLAGAWTKQFGGFMQSVKAGVLAGRSA